MGKFQLSLLSEKERIKIIAELYDALSCVRNRKTAQSVFRDLLTVSEIVMLARRIQVALLLRKGFDYAAITESLGVGRSTVTLVKRKLSTNGKGYNLVCRHLERLDRKFNKKRRPKYVAESEIAFLMRRRADTWLLYNLVAFLGSLVVDKEKQ